MAVEYDIERVENVASSTALVYTTGTVNWAAIDYMYAYNVSPSAVNLNVFIVESGETAGTTNHYLSASIPATEGLLIYDLIGHPLQTGDEVHVSAGSGSALNLTFRVKKDIQI